MVDGIVGLNAIKIVVEDVEAKLVNATILRHLIEAGTVKETLGASAC